MSLTFFTPFLHTSWLEMKIQKYSVFFSYLQPKKEQQIVGDAAKRMNLKLNFLSEAPIKMKIGSNRFVVNPSII